MQQHLMQMQPMMAAYYPSNVTTDHIQQVLSSLLFSGLLFFFSLSVFSKHFTLFANLFCFFGVFCVLLKSKRCLWGCVYIYIMLFSPSICYLSVQVFLLGFVS
ncbi:hypothetical protein OIU74_026594, partial [Salix koriyanagi]